MEREQEPFDYDLRWTLKRDGLYPDSCGATWSIDRGKIWIVVEDKPYLSLSIEAPALRELMKRYEAALVESGLPPITEDGYGR